MNILNLTIKELHKKYVAKELTPQEVTNFYLKRMEEHKELNAFITETPELAIQQAKGKLISDSPLSGVPASIKDVIVTKGVKSTGGSKILKNYIPPYNATLVNKLENAGMVLLGKNNCDEFAQGGSNENSAFGPVKNPWDTSRVSGGSSGGSATAVSAGLVHYAIGTDTGGSVRQPASYCGIVGFKPTYGRVSRYGMMAMGSSLDQAGVLARHVADAKEVFSVIEGEDIKDATSKSVSNITAKQGTNMSSIRVGVPREYFGDGLDNKVKSRIEESINVLKNLGATIIDISLPHFKDALSAYYIIMPAEVSSNMGRYDGIRYGVSQGVGVQKPEASLEELYKANRSEGLGSEVKRRIMLGTYVLSAGYYEAYYARAQKVRQLIKQDFENAFKEVDVIVGPTAPTPAFEIGSKSNDPLSLYLEDIYTVPVNMAGLPAISVPAGFVDKLPVGLHIIGKWDEDYKLLDIAEAFEKETGFYKEQPNL